MLFNSAEFIFFFLPAVFLVYALLARTSHTNVLIGFLVISSLFFYGWWNPVYLALILFSLTFNFAIATGITRRQQPATKKPLLILGLSINLGLLAYFKYTNFAIDSLNQWTGLNIPYTNILLPLGISFFTFQQIAYLVDTYQGRCKEYRFLHYCLFVTFFPQLVAGPIVHYNAVMPQYENQSTFQFKIENLAIGLLIFSIGLFKKAVLADGIAGYSNPVFASAASDMPVSTLEAWAGALAYTFQLYFDFSGYSDMAIGLGLMFGIWLPLNFNSPYKSVSIVEFWRRWHMTLSQFLRDYLYIPLGGNRNGGLQRYRNLLLTMLLGGLWHGAGWNFIIWGGLHGLYLVVNHGWQNLTGAVPGWLNPFRWKPVAILTTFTVVVVAWVFFRAADFASASKLVQAMLCLSGCSLPADIGLALEATGKTSLIPQMESIGLTFLTAPGAVFIRDWALYGTPLILALALLAWFTPNSQEILRLSGTVKQYAAEVQIGNLNTRKAKIWALIAGMLFFTSISTLFSDQPTEFLYFNF